LNRLGVALFAERRSRLGKPRLGIDHTDPTLGFGLKHDGIHLDALDPLMRAPGEKEPNRDAAHDTRAKM
jgi:hypothetical protein